MFEESPKLELKREVTEGLKKEIIAFANTDGGEILIGIDDDGTVVGLANAQKELETVSNILRDSIKPDILVHTSAEIQTIKDKKVLKIEITRGSRRPYHLASKGMKPSGVFIRHGTSASAASDEAIRQMIIESDGTQYENMRCINQSLTFHETKRLFDAEGLTFGQTQQKTLGITNSDNYYTNLGLLLSDQCEHSIKGARYRGVTKLDFQDRKEFNGSVMKQVDEAFEYLQLHNATSTNFDGLHRKDTAEYPVFALREALVNAVVHRDYSFSGSILIHIFDDRIEIVSVGGLVQGLTLEDIELGISQSRNPRLANCFYRMKLIESYGTGLQRIKESYRDSENQPYWHVGPNSFVVTLPKVGIIDASSPESAGLMLWMEENDTFTSKELEDYLKKSKTYIRNKLESLLNDRIIERIGKGRATRYRKI
ncbi:RNA-binding domain-containing protein [Planococcus sp. ISL-109]|uniref:RNA-binding domain-containing protein n=1 Tax=Planococcus sp. ISL-109 TaxID=2819166 RepID=UPI001BEB597F|nr:RNA-binding domain-containing protein [Planococcus sp. ISL-109]MBT2581208.1 putative DNA binding domain-containing protein [Planococcus sp. ISL-109]